MQCKLVFLLVLVQYSPHLAAHTGPCQLRVGVFFDVLPPVTRIMTVDRRAFLGAVLVSCHDHPLRLAVL